MAPRLLLKGGLPDSVGTALRIGVGIEKGAWNGQLSDDLWFRDLLLHPPFRGHLKPPAPSVLLVFNLNDP